MVSGEPPLTQHLQDQGAGGGFQETKQRTHTPITIDKTPVERVNSFKFLCVHISEDLTWSTHTDAVLKKANQRLFFLRWLRKFGMSPIILKTFYTFTIESILTGCINAWFGNSTAGNRKALKRVVRTASHIVVGELPSLQDIYTRQCIRKARRIISDSSHPSHRLLSLLPSGRRLRSIRSRTSRLRDSFFPQAIRLMNSMPHTALYHQQFNTELYIHTAYYTFSSAVVCMVICKLFLQFLEHAPKNFTHQGTCAVVM
uniref:Alkylated DNA repair protein AlkB homologue 8 N-terminal domain-containing protein n=1 Tax=Cyprinus carpio carpio TaxID=630221 RepID=A0A9J7ZCF4_CYPCA